MARYIDADALSYRLEKRIDSVTDLSFAEGLSEAIVEIGLSPTLSPDEVRGVGEWEDNYPILVELECLRCKNCNKLVQIGRYCANCGERKKGADGSE